MCTCSTDDGRTVLAVFNLGLIISILGGNVGVGKYYYYYWRMIIILGGEKDNESRSNNDLVPSCVEDDVEGVVRCVCWCWWWWRMGHGRTDYRLYPVIIILVDNEQVLLLLFLGGRVLISSSCMYYSISNTVLGWLGWMEMEGRRCVWWW